MASGTAMLGIQSNIPTARRRLVDHRFYTGMAFAMAGGIRRFYEDLLCKDLRPQSCNPFWVHVHGAVFTAWILFYLLQNLLAMYGQMKLHRSLGIISGLLAAAVVILGSAIAPPGASRAFLSLPGWVQPPGSLVRSDGALRYLRLLWFATPARCRDAQATDSDVNATVLLPGVRQAAARDQSADSWDSIMLLFCRPGF